MILNKKKKHVYWYVQENQYCHQKFERALKKKSIALSKKPNEKKFHSDAHFNTYILIYICIVPRFFHKSFHNYLLLPKNFVIFGNVSFLINLVILFESGVILWSQLIPA